ncbi:hypothetical protein QUB63_22780 [Microcoleus sp. ARI1-B5]
MTDEPIAFTGATDGTLGEGWDFKIPNYSIDRLGLNNQNIDVNYQ